MKHDFKVGQTRVVKPQFPYLHGIYTLLEHVGSLRDGQWRVLVVEADPAANEVPGEIVVINDGWLTTYTRSQ